MTTPRRLAVLLLALTLLSGCATLPSQPMLAAVTPTVRALAPQLRVASSPGPLTAGAARVEITPAVGASLAGYSRRAGR